MKITSAILTVLFITGIFFSCKKGGDDSSTTPASVTQVSTASGVMGGPKNTLLTITGTNLPTDPSAITVTINGKVCTVVSASATSLVVKVPPYAGTGTIIINLNGVVTNGPVFNYVYTYGLVSITNGIKGYQDGPIASAQWDETSGLCVDTAGNIFTSGYTKPVVRKITADLSTVSTVAGDRTVGDVNGQGTAAKLGNADNISIDKAGTIYYADQGYNKIKKIDKLGNVTTLISNVITNSAPVTAQVGSLGNIYVMGFDRSISKYNAAGVLQWKVRSHAIGTYGNSTDGDSSVVKFDDVSFGNMAIENGETALYFATMTSVSVGGGASGWASQVKKLNLTTLITTTLTGSATVSGVVDGPAASSTFNLVTGLAIDATGGLYIGDGFNDRIRYLKSGIVSTIIGAAGQGDVDGPPATAKIDYPDGLVLTSKGDLVFACVGNNKIKRLVID
jgi:hypothetical protein